MTIPPPKTPIEAGDEQYAANALNQISSRENNSRHISGLGQPGMGVVATGPAGSLAVSATSWGCFCGTEIVLPNDKVTTKFDLLNNVNI